MEEITFDEGDFKKNVQMRFVQGRKPCTLAIKGNDVECSCEGTADRFSLAEVDFVEVKPASITFVMRDSKRYDVFPKDCEVAKRFSEYVKRRGVDLREDSLGEAMPKPADELLPPPKSDSAIDSETTSEDSSDRSSLNESISDECFMTFYNDSRIPVVPSPPSPPKYEIIRVPAEFDV